MGYGAYMTVKNERSSDITLYITGVTCMYDGGKEGSNLSLFNDATVAANTSLPSSGKGQYIEADASGTCFFTTSTFTLKVDGIGDVDFSDSSEDWKYICTNEDLINVFVDNSSDNQATIQVTVEPS